MAAATICCRLCRATTNPKRTVHLFTTKGLKNRWASRISTLLEITVDEDDRLPPYVCSMPRLNNLASLARNVHVSCTNLASMTCTYLTQSCRNSCKIARNSCILARNARDMSVFLHVSCKTCKFHARQTCMIFARTCKAARFLQDHSL